MLVAVEEGVLVGVCVGELVGVPVGDTVGVVVGEIVGELVGELVGVAVGVLVGGFVGVLVGVLVGVWVGVIVGVVVGVPVDVVVGDIVGVAVGPKNQFVLLPESIEELALMTLAARLMLSCTSTKEADTVVGLMCHTAPFAEDRRESIWLEAPDRDRDPVIVCVVPAAKDRVSLTVLVLVRFEKEVEPEID